MFPSFHVLLLQKEPTQVTLTVKEIIFTEHLLSWLISHSVNTALYYRDMCIPLFTCCYYILEKKQKNSWE